LAPAQPQRRARLLDSIVVYPDMRGKLNYKMSEMTTVPVKSSAVSPISADSGYGAVSLRISCPSPLRRWVVIALDAEDIARCRQGMDAATDKVLPHRNSSAEKRRGIENKKHAFGGNPPWPTGSRVPANA
jgi:hypothetical protein